MGKISGPLWGPKYSRCSPGDTGGGRPQKAKGQGLGDGSCCQAEEEPSRGTDLPPSRLSREVRLLFFFSAPPSSALPDPSASSVSLGSRLAHHIS